MSCALCAVLSRSVVSDSATSVDCSPPGSPVHGDFPGKNTGVGCHALLQGIFPTQGSNDCLFRLLHWQADSLPLAIPGGPQNEAGLSFMLCRSWLEAKVHTWAQEGVWSLPGRLAHDPVMVRKTLTRVSIAQVPTLWQALCEAVG